MAAVELKSWAKECRPSLLLDDFSLFLNPPRCEQDPITRDASHFCHRILPTMINHPPTESQINPLLQLLLVKHLVTMIRKVTKRSYCYLRWELWLL